MVHGIEIDGMVRTNGADISEYSYAGGCGAMHPFNKAKRAECEKNHAAKKENGTTLKGKIGSLIHRKRGGKSEAAMTESAQVSNPSEAKERIAPGAKQAMEDKTTDSATAAKKPNTMMYVGIGVGVLALAGIVIAIVKSRS